MTDFFFALGDFLSDTLTYMPNLGNLPNIVMIVVGFGFIVYWISQLAKFEKDEVK